MDITNHEIFRRMQAGETIRKSDPGYGEFSAMVAQTIRQCTEMNASSADLDEIRARLAEVIGSPIDVSTTIFPPFYINFGKFTKLGKDVFINHACSKVVKEHL